LLEGVGSFWGVGLEWQHDWSGFAFFANGSWGDNGNDTVVGGIRFYSGPPKSLIRRHREDDPGSTLLWDLHQCIGEGCNEEPR
jgi:hypothetical protein